MKRIIKTGFTAFSLLLTFLPGLASETKIFVQTTSNGYKITWSDQELSATAGGASLFSAKKIATAERPKKSTKTTVDRAFRLLSAVGPVMSYQDEQTFDWPGMAHPGVGDVRLYHSVDLRHPGLKANLKDYFLAEDIFFALKNNPLLKSARHVSQSENLDALLKAISNSDVMAKDESGDEAKLLLSQDLLSQFAFGKFNGTTVTVFISLYNQTANEIRPLVLNLPVRNADLLLWLKAAASCKSGILANTIESKYGQCETDFHFDP